MTSKPLHIIFVLSFYPKHPPCLIPHLPLPTLHSYSRSSLTDVGVPRAISVYEVGVDVVARLLASHRLKADPGRLERQDVHEAVLELVGRQVGRHEAEGLCLDVGQFLCVDVRGRGALVVLVIGRCDFS